jgi:hypothetical protein
MFLPNGLTSDHNSGLSRRELGEILGGRCPRDRGSAKYYRRAEPYHFGHRL